MCAALANLKSIGTVSVATRPPPPRLCRVCHRTDIPGSSRTFWGAHKTTLTSNERDSIKSVHRQEDSQTLWRRDDKTDSCREGHAVVTAMYSSFQLKGPPVWNGTALRGTGTKVFPWRHGTKFQRTLATPRDRWDPHGYKPPQWMNR